jgi:RNA-directed DNA polymerase
MHGHGNSDNGIVPETTSNKVPPSGTAEADEGRPMDKGNSPKRDTPRTQSRPSMPNALEWVRQAAKTDTKQKFTALMHHIYDVARLKSAYRAVKHDAASGVDGETWSHYGENLRENLEDLSRRLRQGAYRARPVLRVYIPKGDGRQRPIGIPTLEDKIVQRATVEVLNAIYETDFLDFSYGFRPKRNQHNALDALSVGLITRKVGWVLDADIRSFFDSLNHECLIKFIEHRVGDKRVVHLIQKWLNAGVLEEGKRIQKDEGTVQGGSISPLLANIYLHYAFDIWIERWQEDANRGLVTVVRFADDFVVGFQKRKDAEEFQTELQTRLSKFGLELHSEKTRLIEFGRFAAENRAKRKKGKPETFDFLGLTHICGRSKAGKFVVMRHTSRKKVCAKLKEVKNKLRMRMHDPVPSQGRYLRSVLLGHYRYYGVPYNSKKLCSFRWAVGRIWRKTLGRRSHKGRVLWKRMTRLIAKWFPPARLYRGLPKVPAGVTT